VSDWDQIDIGFQSGTAEPLLNGEIAAGGCPGSRRRQRPKRRRGIAWDARSR